VSPGQTEGRPGTEVDANSRGWGLLLRVAGAIVPIGVFFLPAVARHTTAPSFFRGIGRLWAWPWDAYVVAPLGFGLMGLLTLLFAAGILLRRDWRGAIGILIWSLLWGWVILAYVVTDS
jgi:hypothetical protein